MKDVLQLTTAIVMASSAKKKKGMTPKVEKQLACSLLVTISLFKLMMRRKSLHELQVYFFSWIEEGSGVLDT